MRLPLFTSLCLALTLTACSNIPDKLQVAETTNLTSFDSAKAEQVVNVGHSARWGGVIAKVVNNADNSMLEIVHFPLTSSAKPKQGNDTLGRIRVYFSGLLDPVIYKEGRSITALGTISTSEQGKIGEHEYLYPVLKAEYVHLWKNIQRVDVNVMHMGVMNSPMMWRQPRIYHRNPVVIRKNQSQVKQTRPSQSRPSQHRQHRAPKMQQK